MSNEKILDAVLAHEGGFSFVNGDRGGATNFGITQVTLAAWRGYPVTVQHVRDMSREEARHIYEREYIEKPGFGQIKFEPLRYLLVDSAVQHGQTRAAKWLQDALGVKPDGVIGSKTLAMLASVPNQGVFHQVLRSRITFYGDIIARDLSQGKFAGGWMARVSKFVGMV